MVVSSQVRACLVHAPWLLRSPVLCPVLGGRVRAGRLALRCGLQRLGWLCAALFQLPALDGGRFLCRVLRQACSWDAALSEAWVGGLSGVSLRTHRLGV